MKKILLLVLIFVLTSRYGSAQLFDKYGLNAGVAYATQNWDHKTAFYYSDKGFKAGPSIFLSAEKKLNRTFSVRPDFGYIQKGFKNFKEYLFGNWTTAGVANKNLILHDLALNIGLKIAPFKTKCSPYALIGLRADYTIAYKDIIGVEQGSGYEFHMFKSDIDRFNKFNIGYLLGIGLELYDLIYFEIEINPPITSSYNTDLLKVQDVCWGIKAGLNINKLIRK